MISTRRQAPIQLSRTTTGSTPVTVDGAHDLGGNAGAQPVADGCVTTLVVTVVVVSIVTGSTGGEADGTFRDASGPWRFAVERAGDVVTIESIDNPDGVDDAHPVQPDGAGWAFAAGAGISLQPNGDDDVTSGFIFTSQDERTAGGGTRTTTTLVTVERPLETVGS